MHRDVPKKTTNSISSLSQTVKMLSVANSLFKTPKNMPWIRNPSWQKRWVLSAIPIQVQTLI